MFQDQDLARPRVPRPRLQNFGLETTKTVFSWCVLGINAFICVVGLIYKNGCYSRDVIKPWWLPELRYFLLFTFLCSFVFNHAVTGLWLVPQSASSLGLQFFATFLYIFYLPLYSQSGSCLEPGIGNYEIVFNNLLSIFISLFPAKKAN